MNSVNVQGRWTKNPELKFTPTGKPVASGTIAVQRKFKNPQGEYDADFFQVVIWGAISETIANRQEKGNRIGITGRLQSRSYDGEGGKKVYVTEIVAEQLDIIDWADNGQGGQNQNRSQGNQNQNRSQGNQNQGNQGNQWRNNGDDPFAGAGQIDIPDDDLPF
jgi:single-strand DNA-binding protein